MKILVEFNDVLSDTFAELERREGPATDFSVEDLRVMFPGIDLQHYFTSLDFHREIPPVPGAAEGVNWIVAGGHEVRYASARPPDVAEVSQEWLSEWSFPIAQLHCLGREGKKELLRTDPYDLLIDDQMRYLKIAREQGKRAIALSQRWNSTWDGDRIANWDDIEQAL
ncbi:MAG: hypothetical protein ACE5JF_06890 [Anaerolineales bacterium]